jgi:hypothetical protein
MPLPVFFVVDENEQDLRSLMSDLRRRFGADYDVSGSTTQAEALAELAAMSGAGGCWPRPDWTGRACLSSSSTPGWHWSSHRMPR